MSQSALPGPGSAGGKDGAPGGPQDQGLPPQARRPSPERRLPCRYDPPWPQALVEQVMEVDRRSSGEISAVAFRQAAEALRSGPARSAGELKRRLTQPVVSRMDRTPDPWVRATLRDILAMLDGGGAGRWR